MARAIGELGAIDIVVNNAGIPAATTMDAVPSTGGLFPQSNRDQWDRTMGLITYGVLNCGRAVVGGMAERRWGRVISVISDAGRVGEPRLVPYSMAKAGVIGPYEGAGEGDGAQLRDGELRLAGHDGDRCDQGLDRGTGRADHASVSAGEGAREARAAF